MFKGKIHLYKNENWKEVELSKDFDNEKEFDDFIQRNPELKNLSDWSSIRWPSLTWFKDLFEETKRGWDRSFTDEIEKTFEKMEQEMKELFERSRKLLK